MLFFTKGKQTKDIWYYALDPGRSLGKVNPLNDEDLAEFIKLQSNLTVGDNSWIVARSKINKRTYDISVKNPNAFEELTLRPPDEILKEILTSCDKATDILKKMQRAK